MLHRSMTAVLCPSLYNAFNGIPTSQTSKILRTVMEFTDLAIGNRIIYRKHNQINHKEETIADPTIIGTARKVFSKHKYDKVQDK